MVDTLELDYESYSGADIKLGLDLYSAHSHARNLMAAYAFNGGGVKHWQAHQGPLPKDLAEALVDPEVEKWAFNAQFERVMTRRPQRIKTPRKGWRCTMVLAGLMAFNGTLGEIGERIGISEDKQKDKRGKQLIQMFCVPPKDGSPVKDWRSNPAEWEEFCQYNIQDVIAERAIRNRLIKYPVPADEWELYEMDQEINDHGMPVDLEFCRQAIIMSRRRKDELTAEMKKLTGLSNPGSVQQLLPWLTDLGFPFKDLKKESVAKALVLNEAAEGTLLEGDCADVLRLRQWQARLSVKKYDALLNTTGADGNARFLYQMAGAGRTGRWAGRRVQAQNLARTPKSLEADEPMEWANQLIRTGNYDGLSLFMAEPMEALVGCVRSAFRAREGEEFRVVDLASIETAVVALLARCEPLLDIFRQGKDPYKWFGSLFYQKPYEEVTRGERGASKPPMLGCCYRLGGGEIIAGVKTGLWGYAENMGVNLAKEEAHRAVKIYRDELVEVPIFWVDLEKAAERTIQTKKDSTVGLLRFEWRSPFLLLWLPTGRPLFYYRPRLEWRIVKSGRMIERRSRGWDEDGAPAGQMVMVEDTWKKLTMTYEAKHQKTGKWVRIDTHGGRTTEQATQATARDVLKYGMLRAWRDGFRIRGHSHDEAIVTARKGDNYFTVERLQEHLTYPVPGLDGLPLGSAGFASDFYKKD